MQPEQALIMFCSQAAASWTVHFMRLSRSLSATSQALGAPNTS